MTSRPEKRRAQREARKAEKKRRRSEEKSAALRLAKLPRASATPRPGDSAELDAMRKNFLATYGATMIMSLHVQYRLADIYAASFDEPRAGSRPRVTEKWHEAIKKPLGGAHALASEWLPAELRTEVEIAVAWRNYLAHYLIFDTRSQQQTVESLQELISRLMIVHEFFDQLSAKLLDQHRQVFLRAGVSREAFDSTLTLFGNLSDPDPPVQTPKPQERITAVYRAIHMGLPSLVLENEEGAYWQVVDVGLAAVRMTHELRATMQSSPELEQYLPAEVISRPSRKSNPQAWRAPFDFDLEFSTGVTLRIEHTKGSNEVYWEIVPRGPRKK